MNEAWSFEHSVACPVRRAFAWQFWTEVENWKLDADVESIELDGPFAPGSRGATITRSSGRIEWLIAEVQPESSAVIEIDLPDAVIRFAWTFEDFADATRLTQRVSIAGAAAPPIVAAVARNFQEGIPAGMQKLCAAMADAAH